MSTKGTWAVLVISCVEAGGEMQIIEWLQGLENNRGPVTLVQQLTCDNGAQMLFARTEEAPDDPKTP